MQPPAAPARKRPNLGGPAFCLTTVTAVADAVVNAQMGGGGATLSRQASASLGTSNGHSGGHSLGESLGGPQGGLSVGSPYGSTEGAGVHLSHTTSVAGSGSLYASPPGPNRRNLPGLTLPSEAGAPGQDDATDTEGHSASRQQQHHAHHHHNHGGLALELVPPPPPVFNQDDEDIALGVGVTNAAECQRITQVTENIYLGSWRDADNLQLLQQLGITHVIDCAKENEIPMRGVAAANRQRNAHAAAAAIAAAITQAAEASNDATGENNQARRPHSSSSTNHHQGHHGSPNVSSTPQPSGGAELSRKTVSASKMLPPHGGLEAAGGAGSSLNGSFQHLNSSVGTTAPQVVLPPLHPHISMSQAFPSLTIGMQLTPHHSENGGGVNSLNGAGQLGVASSYVGQSTSSIHILGLRSMSSPRGGQAAAAVASNDGSSGASSTVALTTDGLLMQSASAPGASNLLGPDSIQQPGGSQRHSVSSNLTVSTSTPITTMGPCIVTQTRTAFAPSPTAFEGGGTPHSGSTRRFITSSPNNHNNNAGGALPSLNNTTVNSTVSGGGLTTASSLNAEERNEEIPRQSNRDGAEEDDDDDGPRFTTLRLPLDDTQYQALDVPVMEAFRFIERALDNHHSPLRPQQPRSPPATGISPRHNNSNSGTSGNPNATTTSSNQAMAVATAPKGGTVAKADKRPPKILIHCRRGKSRSPAIVIAYLMLKYHLTYPQALERVEQVRDIAMNVAFRIFLMDFIPPPDADLEQWVWGTDADGNPMRVPPPTIQAPSSTTHHHVATPKHDAPQHQQQGHSAAQHQQQQQYPTSQSPDSLTSAHRSPNNVRDGGIEDIAADIVHKAMTTSAPSSATRRRRRSEDGPGDTAAQHHQGGSGEEEDGDEFVNRNGGRSGHKHGPPPVPW